MYKFLKQCWPIRSTHQMFTMKIFLLSAILYVKFYICLVKGMSKREVESQLKKTIHKGNDMFDK